jgi:hypothetical protein
VTHSSQTPGSSIARDDRHSRGDHRSPADRRAKLAPTIDANTVAVEKARAESRQRGFAKYAVVVWLSHCPADGTGSPGCIARADVNDIKAVVEGMPPPPCSKCRGPSERLGSVIVTVPVEIAAREAILAAMGRHALQLARQAPNWIPQ